MLGETRPHKMRPSEEVVPVGDSPLAGKQMKSSSIWLISLVLLFSLGLGITVFVLSHQSKKAAEQPVPTPPPTGGPTPQYQLSPTPTSLSETEQAQIEVWIGKNGLNEYGDPMNTIYAGGTPLFAETTGKTTDRYVYILQKHPERPWRN